MSRYHLANESVLNLAALPSIERWDSEHGPLMSLGRHDLEHPHGKGKGSRDTSSTSTLSLSMPLDGSPCIPFEAAYSELRLITEAYLTYDAPVQLNSRHRTQ